MTLSLLYRRWLGAGLGAAAFAAAMVLLFRSETDAMERSYCLAMAGALALFVAVLSGRFGFGLLVSAALTAMIWFVAQLKLIYLHEPLLAADLHYFFNANTIEVVSHYPNLYRKGVQILLLLAAMLLIWRLESPSRWRTRRKAQLAALAATLVASTVVASPHGPFRAIYSINTWNFISSAHENPVSMFVMSFARMRHEVPTWSPAAATAFDWSADSPPPPTQQHPDIVTVLEESALDPRQWAACDVPRCTFSMFEPDERTVAGGKLRVHTYGGGTWTSEFAFLAGLPHTSFGPAGIYAPYNLAPRMRQSLPRQLKELGYRTVAIYPMPGDFVRARGAYQNYGFDEFHDAKELGLVWESTDQDLIECVERIHQRLRGKDQRPLFLMILTMRQHGPHDKPLEALPPPWNEPPAPKLDARLNRNLGTYLFRMRQSDEALAELRRYLFADGRPTVFAHFGDHHPSFDGLEATLRPRDPKSADAETMHETYYRIDTSFERDELSVAQPLDLAFLGGLVLDAAGLPKNAYFEANTRLRDRCGGRFDNCPQRDLIDSYYAYVFGSLHAFDE